MKTDPFFDLTVDKETNTVQIIREFAASNDLVWDFWTVPELLDQWWGPHPFKSVTKSMDFIEGGRRLYAMFGPNGEEHWGFFDFTSITPKSNFQCVTGYSDNQGNLNTDLPCANWDIDFSESNGTTTVNISMQHDSASDLEIQLQMGFKEGITVCLDQLEELLNN